MPLDLAGLKNKPAEEQNPGPIEVETAFLVFVQPGGMVQVTPDIDLPVVPKRLATFDEIQMYSQKVSDDLTAEKTAQIVQMRVSQAAIAAQSQMESARIAQSLKI